MRNIALVKRIKEEIRKRSADNDAENNFKCVVCNENERPVELNPNYYYIFTKPKGETQ